ncbi:hypothetical protein QMO56_11510 [Roseomonas sp. E05]|uniref:hypothetical protein n=1 Tax=Roseomonas sp. E05 TaxID=3046310 RepID=UPI0024B9BEE5|nr:hypothetical protein [Roseomonas sp. E05]MDJ0388740.1 hypothetical protein [Roseomonas sp. E05]
MKRVIMAAALALPMAACAGGSAPQQRQASIPAGKLLSCGVRQAPGGENGRILYNMSCKPVVGGDIASIENVDGETFNVSYGSGAPAFGGGQVYVLRYGAEPGEIHYGKPLDGNIGTVGR